jgi:ASPIC and UnbV
MREARSNNGYLGQNDPVIHFGLGPHETVDLVVRFLDGTLLRRDQVESNQTVTLDGRK